MTAQPLPAVKQALRQCLHHDLLPQLEQLLDTLPDDLRQLEQAEARLRSGLLQLARRLLECWGAAARRPIERPACPHCGVPMRHKGPVAANLVTTLGDITYRRPRWRCADCGSECYPHDAALRCGGHGVSWSLAKVCGRLAAQIPSFAEARLTLREDYGVALATETVRAIAEDAGQAVLRQEDDYRVAVAERQTDLPHSDATPARAYVYADGTMIHTAGDWHEVRVNVVCTEDGDGRPLQRRSQARFLPPPALGWLLVVMARQVGYQNARQRVFIADGAAWLWKLQQEYFAGATAILDWYHLAAKVHAAANGLHGEGTEAAAQWAARLKTELWEGRSAAVLQEVQALEARTRSPTKRAAVHALRTYLENQQGHLDYPRYRELGLAVGSGPVEGACKSLVGARCKQAGMRNWTYGGAEGILRLRAARQDGTFDKLWEQHLRIAA
jgi:Uncharacterised protein family (UPF0236)